MWWCLFGEFVHSCMIGQNQSVRFKTNIASHIRTECSCGVNRHVKVVKALLLKIWVHDPFKHVGQQSFNDITSHEDSKL